MEKHETDAVYSRALSLYREGFSCKDISLICKIPILTVRQFLQQAGFNTRGYRRASDSNKAKVILLIKAGYPYSQIERLLHISTHLVREIVLKNNMVGFAPNNHPPVTLNVDIDNVSMEQIKLLLEAYYAGEYGLSKCAEQLQITNDEFLWFVYHLTEEDKNVHNEHLKQSVRKMYGDGIPLTAIAKLMDISPSIVKKMI